MGSTIRDIKIISKDINFELWPHKVDTDTETGDWACWSQRHDVGKSIYILNQFRWGSAVLCCVGLCVCQVFSL